MPSSEQISAVPGERSPRVLLLGLGNDILSDDAIGLKVAAALRERLTGDPHVTVGQTCEMGLALLDHVVGFDALVLVDAVQTGTQPAGFVHEVEGTNLALIPNLPPHFLGVGEMLALGRELGLAVPGKVRIFAIEVQDSCTIGTEMTPALQAALPHISNRVLAELRPSCSVT
jgi:hydrogenase maturation protease